MILDDFQFNLKYLKEVRIKKPYKSSINVSKSDLERRSDKKLTNPGYKNSSPILVNNRTKIDNNKAITFRKKE